VTKLLFLFLIVISSVSHGQEGTGQSEYWNPPIPAFSQKFDWLMLHSGEWLKGDIISMYEDELEFDSKEFDIVIFDWKDVKELRSRFDQQIRFANGRVKKGFLIVKDEQLILISNGSEEHYPLSELLSITSASDNRRGLWDGKFSLGMNLRSGNVDEIDYTATAAVQRRTPFTRFNIDFIYNYSKSTIADDDQVLTDTSRLTSYLDWFYSSNVFFRMLDYEHFTDLQQNIKYRNTIGLSFGYHLINDKRLQWDVTIGPSYQQTNYYSTSAENAQNSGVIVLGTLLDYEISSRIDLIFDYQLQLVEEDSGKSNTHIKTAFSFDLKNDFDLDLTFILDRITQPVATEGEIPPEKNDYRLLISLAYKF